MKLTHIGYDELMTTLSMSGLLTEQLAEVLGVCSKTVARWESGTGHPKRHVAQRVRAIGRWLNEIGPKERRRFCLSNLSPADAASLKNGRRLAQVITAIKQRYPDPVDRLVGVVQESKREPL